MNELSCPECGSKNVEPAPVGLESNWCYECYECGLQFDREKSEMIDAAPDVCEHKYVYNGVRYKVGRYKNPEYARLADANPVFYYDFYYCEKCLNKRFEKLPIELDTYATIRYDALPIPAGSEGSDNEA